LVGSNNPALAVEANIPNVLPMHLNMQLTPFGKPYGKRWAFF
jgi:hypothetical protein